MVSVGVGWLSGLGVSFIGRRRGAGGGAGIWLSGHVNWISRDGLGVVFGLNEHIRTGVCFGLNVLGGGCWFIDASPYAAPWHIDP